jgi:thiamine biosynthesis protein ThiC
MKTFRTLLIKTSRVATADAADVARLSPGGGWGTRPLSRARQLQDVEDTIEVSIDVDAVALYVARQAAEHSKGRASACHGHVKARRVSRKILASRSFTAPAPPEPDENDVRRELGYGR